MAETKVQVHSGSGFTGLLFLVFLVLKLTGYISWSWWWVTAPLWAPLVLALLILGIIYTIDAFSKGAFK